MKVYVAEKKVNFVSSVLVRVLPLTIPVPLMARYFDGYDSDGITANGAAGFLWSENTVSFVLLD